MGLMKVRGRIMTYIWYITWNKATRMILKVYITAIVSAVRGN